MVWCGASYNVPMLGTHWIFYLNDLLQYILMSENILCYIHLLIVNSFEDEILLHLQMPSVYT